MVSTKEDVHWRGVPSDLLAEVDAYAESITEDGRRVSRSAALRRLVRRGLADVTRSRKAGGS